ncbi:MAG: BatD family protein [Alphaproteobacteria bacterium]
MLQNVKALSQTDDNSSSFGVSIEVEVDNLKPYLKTETIYTIRIIDSVGIITGQSFPPQENGYFIAQLSNRPTMTKKKVNGKNYNIVEQKFAVIPNKTGKITILPSYFEGLISQNNIKVKLTSREVTINVQPKPEIAVKENLPLFKNLEIIDSWEKNPPHFFENQVVTRNISLIALGTIAEEIPNDINIIEPENITVNKTSSVIKTTYFNNTLMAVKDFVYSYFPNKTGAVIIPETYVGYWNIANNAPQKMLIKGGDFMVYESHNISNVQNKSNLFASIDVDNKTPYLQEQVVMTVKFYDALGINKVNIEEPVLDNFLIYPTSDVVNTQEKIDDTNYNVIVKKYVIFPQKSGILKIPSIAVKTITNDREIVNISSNDITINVKPQPQSLEAKYWLPAHSLSVSSNWDSKDDNFEQGKALRQTIEIRASGLSAEQLPDFEVDKIEGVKTYVSHNQSQNTFDKRGIIGIKTKTIIYLFYEEGLKKIPGLYLDWFNLQTEEKSQEIIAGRTINIIEKTAEEIKKEEKTSKFKRIDKKGIVICFISSLLVLLLLLFFYVLKKLRIKNNNLASLKIWQYCQENNAKLVYKSLVEWGEVMWSDNPPKNPYEIAARLSSIELEAEVVILADCAYGNNYEWDSHNFSVVFKKAYNEFKAQNNKRQKNADLPELYPF